MTTSALDIAVAVPVASSQDVTRAINQFQVPDGLRARLFLLDITFTGSIDVNVDATVVRGASFSVGDALAALAPQIGDAHLILRRADAAYDSAQLQAVIDTFAQQPDADFLTSNMGLAGAGGIQHVVDPARDGERPPQCWDAGLALRNTALSQVGTTAWFPVILDAYLKAFAAGRTGHIESALALVSQDTFASDRFNHYAQLQLLHAHSEPFGIETPWMSIVMPCSVSFVDLAPTLEAVFGQVLPPGTYEVITIDQGDGSLRQRLDTLSFSQPVQNLETPDGTTGAALQAGVDAARGQVVLFLSEDTIPFPELAEHHIRGHRDRPGQLLVLTGSLEHPLENLQTPTARAMSAASDTAWVLEEDGVPLQPAHRMMPGNLSMLRDAVVSAGGFNVARTGAAFEDLGWRLHNQGYELLAVSNARARVRDSGNIDRWLAMVEQRETDRVSLHAESAKALDASGHQDLTVTGLEALLEEHAGSVEPVRAALDGMADGPKLYAIENLGGEWAQLSKELEARAASLLIHLQRVAEARGRLAGLKAIGQSSYAEMLRSQTLPLPGARGTRYLLRPLAGDETEWLGALARFLVGFGPMDDTTLVVFADPVNGGASAEEIRTGVLELTKRITPGPNGGWADVQVAEANNTPGELERLVGTVDGWIPTGNEGDRTIEALAEQSGTSALASEDWLLRGTDGVEPWPIVTRARFRLFVWPDWSNEEELKTVFDSLARPLANRDDAALVLRYDLSTDGEPEENLTRMAAAYEEVLGDGYSLEVVLLDDHGDEDDFIPRLAAGMHAVGILPSSEDGPRKDFIAALGLPGVSDMMGVTTQLFSMAPLPLGPLYIPTLSLY